MHFIPVEGRGAFTALIIFASIMFVTVLVDATGWHVPDWQTYIAMATL